MDLGLSAVQRLSVPPLRAFLRRFILFSPHSPSSSSSLSSSSSFHKPTSRNNENHHAHADARRIGSVNRRRCKIAQPSSNWRNRFDEVSFWNAATLLFLIFNTLIFRVFVGISRPNQSKRIKGRKRNPKLVHEMFAVCPVNGREVFFK